MKGPKNYIASTYESIPVAITVEGANILTRNLMIFGQGAIRSHPFVLKEMELEVAEDNNETLEEFDTTLIGHLGFGVSNFARAIVLGLGLPVGDSPAESSQCNPYYRRINRLSSVFALTADISMLTLGAKLKFKENLSARLGDLLSTLFLASMVLKNHKDNNYARDEWPIVQWSLDHLLHEFQIAFDELMLNFPNRVVAGVIKTAAFPIGRRFKAPLDSLEKKVVEIISQDSGARQRLTSGPFMQAGENNPLAEVNQVFLDSLKLQPIQQTIRAAIKDGTLPKLAGEALIKAALKANIINKKEANELTKFEARLMDIINVDDFDESELVRVKHKKPRAILRKAS
jgi:acyl-CoA dehydrogenase